MRFGRHPADSRAYLEPQSTYSSSDCLAGLGSSPVPAEDALAVCPAPSPCVSVRSAGQAVETYGDLAGKLGHYEL